MTTTFKRLGMHEVLSSTGFSLRRYPGQVKTALYESGDGHSMTVRIQEGDTGDAYYLDNHWQHPFEEDPIAREEFLAVMDDVSSALDFLGRPYQLECSAIGRVMYEGDWGEAARAALRSTYRRLPGGCTQCPSGHLIRMADRFPNLLLEVGTHRMEVRAEPAAQGLVYTMAGKWLPPYDCQDVPPVLHATIAHELAMSLVLEGEPFDLINAAIDRHASSRGWKHARRT